MEATQQSFHENGEHPQQQGEGQVSKPNQGIFDSMTA
jgi:hypothetical protein